MPTNIFETRADADEYIKKHKLERDYEIVVSFDRKDKKIKHSILLKPKIAMRRNRLKRGIR